MSLGIILIRVTEQQGSGDTVYDPGCVNPLWRQEQPRPLRAAALNASFYVMTKESKGNCTLICEVITLVLV